MANKLNLSNVAKVVVFNDSTYPQALSEAALTILLPLQYSLAQATDLSAKIEQGCTTLISFHGPYFPKQAWPSILRFLENGGNLAVLGGLPFTRPVTLEGLVEPEQIAYANQLYLGPRYQIEPVCQDDLKLVANEAAAFLDDCALTLPFSDAGTFWTFYPKLTQTSDHPDEMGSAGPVDTVLTPLIFAVNAKPELTKVATPALLLDQKAVQFKGGRWFISTWQPASEKTWLENSEAIHRFICLAVQGLNSVEVRPVLACYQPGETPGLVVSARVAVPFKVQLTVWPSGSTKQITTSSNSKLEFEFEFASSPLLQEHRFNLPGQFEPGLYQVEMLYSTLDGLNLRQSTGFWVWDAALAVANTKGKRLESGRDYFFQAGEPFPVCGTTYMDSSIQRKFLTLPNPARWDKDFAEMQAAGINLVRTGIWTAWRELMPVAGVINESSLRALDAFVLTACKYDIQLIFTYFAFYPPLFEGENPWLDPRSLEAQQDFVSNLARRYVEVELVAWDLINEPSFGDPKRIFSTRPFPNYDRFELAAFQNWLQKRYTLAALQQRWQLTPVQLPGWEQLSLPESQDYQTDVRYNKPRNMFKVADYTLFSQEIFSQWAATMYATIRSAGSQTLVGVGQDEAGVRIAPQFYAESVDYTTTHPWWNNDALLWDMLLDKTPFKPNLIQETGVMLVRDVDGRPWRSEQENANLLERKLWLGLAARSAGLIQWLWHTNAYMTSDNENYIGLVRSDGSAKPELAVMQEFGKVMRVLQPLLKENPELPQVWLVVPYSQWLLRPELGVEATQRAVRLLGYDFGIVPQLVGEQQLAKLVQAGQVPETIILPAVQNLDQTAGIVLEKLVQQGVTLLVSGLAWEQIETLGKEFTASQPVSRYEQLQGPAGQSYQLTYGGEKIGYVKKVHNECREYVLGAGKIIWAGLPLELADDAGATRKFYQYGLGQAEKECRKDSPVFIVRQVLKEGLLVIVESESSSRQKIQLDEGLCLEIAPNRAGGVIFKPNQSPQTFGGLITISN